MLSDRKKSQDKTPNSIYLPPPNAYPLGPPKTGGSNYRVGLTALGFPRAKHPSLRKERKI